MSQIFNGDFYARMVGVMILAVMLVIYIERFETEVVDHRNSGVLDFVFAFFGSYGKLQETEKHLQEWQNRFHAVFDHSTEIIITCDDRGKIIDANIAAKELFHSLKNGNAADVRLDKLMTTEQGEVIELPVNISSPVQIDCITCEAESERKILQTSIFPVQLPQRLLLVMTARDVTREREYAREKEALTEQLNHSQRLESLGILAGGIAHDFNNCIHAILGYVDVATIFNQNDPEAMRTQLEKIGNIAEQAGKLTGQMLGFARRGKYHVVEIDISTLFEQCRMLISPQKLGTVNFEVTLPEKDLKISADTFQMQQVLINMLLNAVDALNGVAEPKLELFALEAVDSPVPFAPPPGDLENALPSDYLAIVIRDNGCGMSPEVADRIFEPFFTTKPVGSGTGMGLSMAYGIIANHKGWIQLKSAENSGTAFAIFMRKVL